MYKLFVLCLSVLVLRSFSASGQYKTANKFGTGIAEFSFDSNTVIRLYKDTMDHTPLKELVFFNDSSINSYNIKNLKDYESSWLQPEGVQLDYSRLYFRVDTITKNWFRVLVNNETGFCLWANRKENKIDYETWNTFIKNVFAVDRIDPIKNPIREKPDAKAKIVNYQWPDGFLIKKIQGDWAQIVECDCGDRLTDGKVIGWILWKTKDKLLVEYYLD
jgi:hypothetical protein